MLIRDAEVEGRRVDVRVAGGVLAEIGTGLREGDAIDAHGGALLPGLHDHHLHLLAMAAALGSVHVGRDGLAGIRTARPDDTGWIRAIGYHESLAGDLDRHRLDELRDDVPVRLQHRSGALWMVNSAGLRRLGRSDHPDGRLFRQDDRIREHTGPAPDLAAVGRRLAGLGVTGVTDATPDLQPGGVDLLISAALPQRIQLLGTDHIEHDRITVGPWKILPPDHEPPDLDGLATRIRHAHDRGRAVAVHVVTRESLVVLLAALDETGVLEGDRIEHAALVPAELIPRIAAMNLRVVTQPGMYAERRAGYHTEIPESEQCDLYRLAGLVDGGVRTALSSDAPFAGEDPWRILAAATDRPDAEAVPARTALDGLLTPLDDPGGRPRRVEVGAPADLCLLAAPLAVALDAPHADLVTATICAGEVVHHR